MEIFNGAFPILPGKTEQARKFAAEVAGGKRGDYEASLKRTGVSRETWSLQQTPMGDLMVVWFEARDVERAFADFAVSKDPMDVWFREQVLDLTGVDLASPMEGPPPEIVAEFRT